MKINIHKIKVFLPILILLLFTLPNINESYFIDEIYSVHNAKTLDEIFLDVHPPLYTLTLKVWIYFFGDGEVLTRILSLIAGIIAVYLLSQINFNAGLLLSISPIVHDVSVTTRGYSLLLLFGVLALYFLVKEKKYIFIPTVLMSLTHYFGLFTSLGIHAYEIIKKRNRESVINFVVFLVIISSWTIFHFTQMNLNAGGWITELKLLEFFSGALGSTYEYAFVLWFLLIWKMPFMERIIFSFALIPPVILSLIRPQLYAHYTLALVPFTMYYIGKKYKGKQFVYILLIFLIMLFMSSPIFMKQDYRAASAMIAEYENPMIISLEVDQSYYFDETKVCGHEICIEWAILEEHDSIWMINGAFADADYYSKPLLDNYEETIFWFESLEVRRYLAIER